MTFDQYLIYLEKWSGLLSRMKHRDEEDSFRKVIDNLFKESLVNSTKGK